MNSPGCNPGFERNNPFTTLNGLNISASFNHFMVVIVFHFISAGFHPGLFKLNLFGILLAGNFDSD